MKRALLALASITSLAGSATAGVTVINSAIGAPDTFSGGNFTLKLPEGAPGNTTGVYGVETRVGKLNGADWQVGVGPGTSQPGYFQQANRSWSPTGDTWSLTWTAAGISFSIDGGAPVTSGPSAALDGNTLKIYNKSGSVSVTSIDGTTFGSPVSIAAGDSALFYSKSDWGGDGFTATGTLYLPNQSGAIKGSSNEILFKSGAWSPTPEPATWVMMIIGVGMIGAALRRRRAATTTTA